jgi:gliding motility-associated-like protein
VGGNNADASHTIKFDPQGNIVFAGGTNSINFPTTTGVYQKVHAGSVDGWIARIDKEGAAIITSTFTGTASFNQVYFIDLDTDGNVYAFGQTSGAFPTTTGVYKNSNSGQFLQKFNAELSELKFSTVFGSGRGIPDISPTAFLVNDCNNIYMSGWGGSINSELGYWNSSTVGMPITSDAIQKTTSGSDFYFILLTGDASELLYATYLGGTQSKTHVDGGTSRFDKSGVVYHAVCAGCAALNPTGRATSDFPSTVGAWSQLNRSMNCNNAAFKFDLSLLKARIQTNSVSLTQPGLNRICIPDKIVFQNYSTGGQFYEWDFGDGNKQVKMDTSLIVYQYTNPGSYRVKLTAIDQGTCIGIDSTFTTISVFRKLGVAGPDQTMCFDAATTLLANGGIQYDWTSADNTFKSTQQNPRINPERDTRYFVSIADINGCVRKDTVDVAVIPGIDLKFEYERIYDCINRPVLSVTNLTETEAQTFFDFGDGTSSDLEAAQHTYEDDGTYLLRLIGVREGCVYERVEPIPIYTLIVPNVITPDEYPENNNFNVLYGGVSIATAQLKVELKIYNRWGKLIYENQNYNNDWAGANVEAGVYYYELKAENETTCKGWVSVLK